MSQAEKFLTAANTSEALKAERAAVEALQRAFARDRYLLRALATRSQLDLGRRLTGAVTQTLGWRRQLLAAPENLRALRLQDLVAGIGNAASANDVAVLAETAIRIDPDSASLRQVAADLQQAADSWSTRDRARRSAALDAVARSVTLEARRSLADAPAISGARR